MNLTRARRQWLPCALLAVLAPVLQVSCGGNASAPAAAADTTPPTVAISGTSTTAVSAAVTLTFTFSEDIGSSFTAGDVTVTNGTAASAVTKVDSTHYTLVVTPATNSTGTMTISLAAGSYSDTAGNANTAAATATQPFSTVAAVSSYAVLDFNTSGLTYKATDFGGDSSTFPATSAPTGGPSTPVVQIVKTSGSYTWAGTTLSVGYLDSVGALPFSSTATSLTAVVYSASGIVFRLKAEDASDATHTVEADATTATAGWQTLTFDMASPATGTAALNTAYTYNKVSVFPSFGTAPTADQTYYVGPIKFIGATAAAAAPLTAPVDTTPPTVAISGTSSTAVTGAMTLTFTFSEDIGTSFTASDVTVTGATADAAVAKVDSTHYTLGITPPSASTGTITISIPAGAFSDTSSNVNTSSYVATQDYNTTVAVTSYPVLDFNTTGLTYTMTDFGGDASTFPATSAPSGGPSTPVVEVIKTAGAYTWAGTTMSVGYLNSIGTLPFSATATKLTAVVYAPAAMDIKLKVEDASDATHSVETDVTAAAGWQTLTFDMATPASGTSALNLAYTYNKISIFPDFGVAPAAAETVYVGPITFIGASAASAAPLATPTTTSSYATVTFDTSSTTYYHVDFGSNSSTLVADPAGASGTVLSITKPAGAETWAGTTVGDSGSSSKPTVGTIPFTSARTKFSVRVYSPAAGLTIRLKLEDSADATHTVETDAVTTTAGAWETLTFNFGSPATGTAALNLAYTFNMMSVFPDFGVSPTAAVGPFYLDDFTFMP